MNSLMQMDESPHLAEKYRVFPEYCPSTSNVCFNFGGSNLPITWLWDIEL